MSNPPKFNLGDVAPGGLKISYIYGQTDKVLVFRSDENVVGHFIDEDKVSEQVNVVLKAYHEVHNKGFRAYPKKKWNTLLDELGAALYNGLSAPSIDDASSAFDDLKRHVAEQTANRGRYLYLVAATVASLVFFMLAGCSFIWFLAPEKSIYALCAMFAVGGALASVIIRSSDILIDPEEDHNITLLRGVYRIVLAVLLAAFMIAAAKANLIAGIVATTDWALVVYSFVCGFSERFVPEIIAGLESRNNRIPKPKK